MLSWRFDHGVMQLRCSEMYGIHNNVMITSNDADTTTTGSGKDVDVVVLQCCLTRGWPSFAV